MYRVILITLLVCAALLPIYTVSVYGAMSSTKYKIQLDSLNSGGLDSTSARYASEDTIGEQATGPSASAKYSMNAGYQQMQGVYLSISASSPIVLSDINGLTGGASSGSGSWTVITDDSAGYSLSIRTATNPALKGSIASFPDYIPAGANPDYTFAVSSASSAFGYTPEGADIVQRFKDSGVSCNTGILDTPDACWQGLSTSDTMIAKGLTSNHPLGTATVVKFKAQSGTSHIQENDAYSASVTLTAIAL